MSVNGESELSEVSKPVRTGNTDIQDEPSETTTRLSDASLANVGEKLPHYLQTNSIFTRDSVIPTATVGNNEILFDATIDAEKNFQKESLRLVKDAGVANPDKFISEAFEGAKKIFSAPLEDRQRIFTKIIADSLKNHPEAANGIFSGLLNSALSETPGSTLSVSTHESVAVLNDKNARTTENPGGIVASAFQGGSKMSIERDRAIFDAAFASARIFDTSINQLDPAKRKAFNSSYEKLSETLKSLGMLEPLGTTSARERPGNPDYLKQLEQIKGLSPDMSESDAAELLLAANSIAFATPAEMQARFSEAMTRLQTNRTDTLNARPAIKADNIIQELVGAMNIVTNSKDFSKSVDNSSSYFLNDARQATEGNPRGKVAFYLLNPDELNKAAFNTVIAMRAEILRASNFFAPLQGGNEFGNSVLSTMRLIPKQ